MAKGVEFRMLGVSEITAHLREVGRKFPNEVAKALYEEANIEMTESKKRVPVDTGALRSSGHVTKPNYQGRRIGVSLVYGNAAALYAVYVHEDEDAFHPVGEAKFLESVMNESAPHMARRLAARISDALI